MLSPRLKLYLGLIVRTKFHADLRIIGALDTLIRNLNSPTVPPPKAETLWVLAIWGYAKFIGRNGWAAFNARWAWTSD
jgi:hypothetical protein